MAKEDTIISIEKDIDQKRLGRARDRLHGLISTYPNDLDLRCRLAEIYQMLHCQEMAGRYWYLNGNRTTLMQEACEAFEKSMGQDPYKISGALKFKGEIRELTDSYAREKLDELQRHRNGMAKLRRNEGRKEKLGRITSTLASWLLIVVMIAVFIVGVVTIISWLI